MQLRKLLEEDKISDSTELREYIDSESDEEISDEFVNVRLKNFEDLRKLSISAGMREAYVIHYQPESTVVHGHWPALRRYYLEACREPLHRLHLQPSLGLPPLNPRLILRAFTLFADSYQIWITHYKLPDLMSPLVDKYLERCDEITKEAPAKAE
jgi:hypothetical protein